MVTAGEKASMVSYFSSGRVTSTTGMTKEEASHFIHSLDARINTYDARNRMRRKIIAMAHEMGQELASGAVDMKWLNGWCVKFGRYHKPLNDHSRNELAQLVSQFGKVFQSRTKKIQ